MSSNETLFIGGICRIIEFSCLNRMNLEAIGSEIAMTSARVVSNLYEVNQIYSEAHFYKNLILNHLLRQISVLPT